MGPSEDGPNGSSRRHVRVKSELLHDADGDLRFRARCSCGWTSQPVSAGSVVAVWERHHEASTGRASVT
jgi:hypothetical protein